MPPAGPRTTREVPTLPRTAALTLEHLALRGNVPPELADIAEPRYRELHVRPWRII